MKTWAFLVLLGVCVAHLVPVNMATVTFNNGEEKLAKDGDDGCSGMRIDEDHCVEDLVEVVTKSGLEKLVTEQRRNGLDVYVAGAKFGDWVVRLARHTFVREKHLVCFVICLDCAGFESNEVRFFAKVENPHCLLREDQMSDPILRKFTPSGLLDQFDAKLDAPSTVEEIVGFVNHNSKTFRMVNGSLTDLGSLIESLENSFFTHKDEKKCAEMDARDFTWEAFQPYLLKKRPLIIKNGAKVWLPSLYKMDASNLLERFGKKPVQVKVVPRNEKDGYGHFECCEPLSLWEGEIRKPPDHVKNRFVDPDIALVRPAHTLMTVEELLNGLFSKEYEHLSLYVEYFRVTDSEMGFEFETNELPRDLILEVQNAWISGGRTIGCLHFDAFENLLAQIMGTKTFSLIEPYSNARLYEGHLREAIFEFHNDTKTITRTKLMESTSIVNSVADKLTETDSIRFPAFEPVKSEIIECHVEEGDLLYMPSFYWHSVRSEKGRESLNLAYNWWFKPLFDKVYPCQNCKHSANVDDYRSFFMNQINRNK